MKMTTRSVAIAILFLRNLLHFKDVGLAEGSWPVQGWCVNFLNLFCVIELEILMCTFLTHSCLIYLL